MAIEDSEPRKETKGLSLIYPLLPLNAASFHLNIKFGLVKYNCHYFDFFGSNDPEVSILRQCHHSCHTSQIDISRILFTKISLLTTAILLGFWAKYMLAYSRSLNSYLMISFKNLTIEKIYNELLILVIFLS